MKFLFAFEPCASAYIYSGIMKALQNLDHECSFWYRDQNSAFDIFNIIQPDVFFGQSYNLTRAELKIINQNPTMRVVLKAGIFGTIQYEPDINDYQMLFASNEEKEKVAQIENKNRLFLFNYHIQHYNDYILGGWKNLNYNTFALPPMGDSYNFYPEYNEKIKTDIGFCGGYWEYKGRNINKYILPLCYPVGKYNIKIFGNQHWPCPQYNGTIGDKLVRQLYSSSKIVPCVHEPQSCRYGFEILSRLYNPILCKTLVISDYVESIHQLFPDNEIRTFYNPNDYQDAIDYYLYNEQDRLDAIEKQYKKVSENYTYNQLMPKILEIING